MQIIMKMAVLWASFNRRMIGKSFSTRILDVNLDSQLKRLEHVQKVSIIPWFKAKKHFWANPRKTRSWYSNSIISLVRQFCSTPNPAGPFDPKYTISLHLCDEVGCVQVESQDGYPRESGLPTIIFQGRAVNFQVLSETMNGLYHTHQSPTSGPAKTSHLPNRTAELFFLIQTLDVSSYCWWKKSGVHQLRLVVYSVFYRVLYIPGGDRRISEPSTVLISIPGPSKGFQLVPLQVVNSP